VPRVGSSRRGAGGVAALTSRQRDVAALVAEGYTNKRIAETLYISERTVESNLTSIFRKLGVSSRAEVAREVVRSPDWHGLARPSR
jgi:DNA-binding NarL/FixJ family response regulator